MNGNMDRDPIQHAAPVAIAPNPSRLKYLREFDMREIMEIKFVDGLWASIRDQ
jgi:hypothetical protein